MDSCTVYVALRTTYLEPRHYGVRVGLPGNPGDYDECDLDSTCFDTLIWDQAGRLARSAFGDAAWEPLVPNQSTNSVTEAFSECMYCLDPHGAWAERHPKISQRVLISFRIPGTHPDEDVYEDFHDIEEGFKTVEFDEAIWYVAQLVYNGEEEGFVYVPAAVAKKSLRKISELPEHS